MKIEPLFSQIWIAPIEENGIIRDDTDPTYLMYGKVIATGPDCKVVKEGDLICYLIWGLNHIELDGKRQYFVPEDKEFLLAKLYDVA